MDHPLNHVQAQAVQTIASLAMNLPPMKGQDDRKATMALILRNLLTICTGVEVQAPIEPTPATSEEIDTSQP